MSETTGAAGVRLLTVECPPGGRIDGREIALGDLVSVSAAQASNILRDVREMVTNALGGRLSRYEALIELTKQRALERFREALAAEGYDGALGVRFAHPHVVDGGAELIVYGTGFRFQ